MTDLSCKAENCCYNKEECCTKGDIHVGGKNACDCSETNCDSFADKCKTEFASSLCPEPGTTKVSCEAVNCMYNTDAACTAPHVNIQGRNAGYPKETTCSTFREK